MGWAPFERDHWFRTYFVPSPPMPCSADHPEQIEHAGGWTSERKYSPKPAVYFLFRRARNVLNTRFWALDMEHDKAFGIVFRRLRRQKGLTQEAFQPVASDRYVRSLEKGEYSPTIAMLCDLCGLLEISPITLLCLVEAEYLGNDATTLMKQAGKELDELKRG